MRSINPRFTYLLTYLLTDFQNLRRNFFRLWIVRCEFSTQQKWN